MSAFGPKRTPGVHVIAFKMKMGRDAQSIEHEDRDKLNNRWSNLREGGVFYRIRQSLRRHDPPVR